MSIKLLIVDDDPIQHELLTAIIETSMGYETVCVSGGLEAVDYLLSDKGSDISVMLLDIVMPDMDGIGVIAKIRPVRPELGIIMITSQNDMGLAVKTIKMGADDFVLKQEKPERLITSIENVLGRRRLSDEVSRLERTAHGQVTFADIIGQSTKSIRDAIATAQKAASSDIPVLLSGESGVGKELFARAIHGCSKRVENPFVAVNCGAIPENLVESTLFGHEKGSFTGASYKNLGKFREADGGTLFLDEIGELRPDIQVKLLRALQNGEIEPIGGKTTSVNVRVISATHRDLKKEMETGRFREDLFYRLKVLPIKIPSLRDRINDIDALINHFFVKICSRENKKLHGITDDAIKILKSYNWPGNIRQLENSIFRAVVVSESDFLTPADFIHLNSGEAPSTSAESGQINNGLLLVDQSGQFKNIHVIEGEIIRAALEFYNWRISEVARRIGLGRSTLYRKMSELGIHHPHGGSFQEDDEDGSDSKIIKFRK